MCIRYLKNEMKSSILNQSFLNSLSLFPSIFLLIRFSFTSFSSCRREDGWLLVIPIFPRFRAVIERTSFSIPFLFLKETTHNHGHFRYFKHFIFVHFPFNWLLIGLLGLCTLDLRLQLILQWSTGILVLICCFIEKKKFSAEITSKLGSSFSIVPFVIVVVSILAFSSSCDYYSFISDKGVVSRKRSNTPVPTNTKLSERA